MKTTHPEMHLTEEYVNEWGYLLLRQGKGSQAIEVFRLNVGLYLTNWNTYDSLAEAYALHGEKALAISAYKRA